MRIRTKLTIMLLVPTLALAGVVSLRIVESAADARDVGVTAEVVELVGDVSRAIDAVQHERLAAAMLVFQEDTGLDDVETLLEHFDETEAVADAELEALAASRSELELDAEMTALLDRADKPLERLPIARAAINDETVAEVHLTVYNSLISRLRAVIDRAVDVADTADLSRHLRTAGLLTAIDENSEQLRILVLGLEDGKPLAEDYRPFMRLSAARDEALVQYRRIAAQTDPDAAVFKVGGLGAADARPANTFESQVAGSRSDDSHDLDHTELMAAYDARHEATAGLVGESLDATDALATDIRDAVLQRLAIESAIAVAAMALAVLIAFGIGRSVTRGLRRLSGSARQIAMVDLPRAVKRVEEQEGLGGLTPFEFAARTTPPLQTKGRDELSEVGEAFNIVHREAIRISAQQALLRFHIGAVFVRLARRGHSLTGRLTAELDEAERNESDPERLNRLFRLDHLVSLVGRANDSLLVLGGSSAAKVRTTDAKLSDVLTAAQSRIEYYTRVELRSDDGAWVKSEAVDDMVQMLAELMDNATRYSESAAEVTARVLTGRAVIEIRDQGIGIEPERMAHFNDRLRRRVPIDLEALQSMGLTVVGHLAARLGIEVELRPTVGGGTVAEIAIPGPLLSFTEPEKKERPQSALPAAPPPPKPEEPQVQRRNAPLFQQSSSPAPVPPPAMQAPPRPPAQAIPIRPPAAIDSAPARGTATVPSQPALPAVPALNAPKRLISEIPDLKFDVQYVHAEPSLRAGHALPKSEPAEPLTEGGLPRRQPMSNLVPGAIAPTSERAGQPVQRDPKTISATYSAYARGLAGSRNQQQPND
ncbi:ATP-binding protein [Glycomyces sp. L485]|uniref:sensor histidine kinase n=1 Tax=Glycomyces sp. L485 TaxID=2909235 RepID=UPI001F4BC605|nr:ATP-binding protein [Glycomyces sp. L485]MCH7230723.1 ATP-binding protein [Glycomyces sp. L485]